MYITAIKEISKSRLMRWVSVQPSLHGGRRHDSVCGSCRLHLVGQVRCILSVTSQDRTMPSRLPRIARLAYARPAARTLHHMGEGAHISSGGGEFKAN